MGISHRHLDSQRVGAISRLYHFMQVTYIFKASFFVKLGDSEIHVCLFNKYFLSAFSVPQDLMLGALFSTTGGVSESFEIKYREL